MNPAVVKLAVDDARYFRIGDVVRSTSTGEAFVVSSSRGGGPRYWEPVRFRDALRGWWHGRGWQRTRVTEKWAGGVRVYKLRPSPLPRRLP